MFASPWKFICWNNSQYDDIRSRSFGEWLGDEGGSLINGINVLIKATLKSSFTLLPCENTAKRQSSVNQETSPHQTANLLASSYWLPQPPEPWEINFCCLFFFNFYFYFILLYNTVLVLPYIDMNPTRVYMWSQTWTPPPSSLHTTSLWLIPVHQPQACYILHRT